MTEISDQIRTLKTTFEGASLGRILFAWELGGGTGHLAPHRELLAALIDRGHEIHVAARDLAAAGFVFKGLAVRYWQSPYSQRSPARVFQPTLTMSHILHNVGFSDADELVSRLQAWRNLYIAIRPELLLADYSPTALAASRDRTMAQAVLGTGFCIPPRKTPLPSFVSLAHLVTDQSQLAADEAILVMTINSALQRGGLPLMGSLADLFHQTDAHILTTIPELDHYPDREEAVYWGLPAEPPGIKVEWPASDRRRVFAYLKPFDAIGSLLDLLGKLELPTMVACDGLSVELRQRYISRTLAFAPPQVDLQQMAHDCHFAITNANHTTTGRFLLAGKPVMMIPLHLEQELIADSVKRIGAGIVVRPNQPRDAFTGLTPLLNESNLHAAAAALAAKYSESHQDRIERMCNYLERLIDA